MLRCNYACGIFHQESMKYSRKRRVLYNSLANKHSFSYTIHEYNVFNTCIFIRSNCYFYSLCTVSQYLKYSIQFKIPCNINQLMLFVKCWENWYSISHRLCVSYVSFCKCFYFSSRYHEFVCAVASCNGNATINKCAHNFTYVKVSSNWCLCYFAVHCCCCSMYFFGFS